MKVYTSEDINEILNNAYCCFLPEMVEDTLHGLHPCFKGFLEHGEIIAIFLFNQYVYLGNEEINAFDHKSYFVNAFKWSDTPQGYDFWAKQDKEWREIVDNSMVNCSYIQQDKPSIVSFHGTDTYEKKI